jgi:hypothetical protein
VRRSPIDAMECGLQVVSPLSDGIQGDAPVADVGKQVQVTR